MSKKAKPAVDGERTANKGLLCSEKGCTKPATARSKCSAHYAAARRLDPAVRQKAREASARAYAKKKAGEGE
ncbi:hypothetical protein EEW87_16325 [Janibacter melonis]|uniref:Vegetative protein n=1 Tax=Janibacter melonis TaxID=262209 RepID=A0A650GD19_9MICO|nr:hypothetical protein [Janibacter melonis]QGX08237.1 hypothetical protein EEW87_16325 [Janibacter melonis]